MNIFITKIKCFFNVSAYLYRADYNIFTIDWADLTAFPCYLSSLSNTRLVAQCTAKLYAFVMDNGGDAEESTCVGHSLGAHICGMVSNHLTIKQHKIVGKFIHCFCLILGQKMVLDTLYISKFGQTIR